MLEAAWTYTCEFETFVYDGKEHTLSLVSYLGLPMTIMLKSQLYTPSFLPTSSLKYHNWEHALHITYLLTMAIADYALTQGYTLAWDGMLTKNSHNKKAWPGTGR